MAFDLKDYVDVKARINIFREKYPTGSLQPANLDKPYTIEKIGDKTFIVFVAAAYRTPDDPKPGIGSAMEPIPGLTPYTKNSELMNAETSAWGRAIVAALAVDRLETIASADEVGNRMHEERAVPEKDASVVPFRGLQKVDKGVGPQTVPQETPIPAHPSMGGNTAGEASMKQKNFVRSMLTKLELGDRDLLALTGQSIETLDKFTAKRLLDDLLAVQRGACHIVYGANDEIAIVPTEGAE